MMEPHITLSEPGYIEFLGEIGRCPNCKNPMQDLVYLGREKEDSGWDGEWDNYRCPVCDAHITFGVNYKLGTCTWGEDYVWKEL
jgi:hypothetical protein